MREMTINDFSDALASSAPVPGGGGVSALVSALGAGLGVVVGSLTIGKKKYAANEAEMREITAQAKRIQERLLELVDADAECFEPLSRAYAMPKDAPERDVVMESCLALAASAPMEIAEISCRAIELMERFALLGSVLAVSDERKDPCHARKICSGGEQNLRFRRRTTYGIKTNAVNTAL